MGQGIPDRIRLSALEVTRRAFLAGGILAVAAGCSSVDVSRRVATGGPAAAASHAPAYRLKTRDSGMILAHGGGPGGCDVYGCREAIVFTDGTRYYLHYDGAGPHGWLACLAVSEDGLSWKRMGPVLSLGAAGRPDSASASSPWVIEHNRRWYMYYLGTPHAGPAPGRLPEPPYNTCLAVADMPTGPWRKRYDVIPFTEVPGTYHATTASPGAVIEHDGRFLQFFSGSTVTAHGLRRTLGIAQTENLASPWTVNPTPLLPLDTDIENSSVYYEPADGGWWWLFTNHISERAPAHTDAAYAYWSRDPTHWDSAHCAIALDTTICTWSKGVIGMPTVLPIGGRLAMFYDGVTGASQSNLGRDIGMATLPIPLLPPT